MLSGQKQVGHPVDVATGVVYATHTDFAVPGRLDIVWERRYSTALLAQPAGPLGRGWTHSFLATLERTAEGYLFRTPEGALIEFSDPDHSAERGTVVRNVGAFHEIGFRRGLCHIVRWDVETLELDRFVFQPTPRASLWPLRSIEEATEGPRIEMFYDDFGRLVRLRQLQERRTFVIEYGGELIRSIGLLLASGQVQNLVRYEYDTAGMLSAAFDALGFADHYEYDSAGRVIREVARNFGIFSFQYDERGRCIRTSGGGGYDEKTLHFKERLPWTEVTDSHGATRKYQYNKDGQVLHEIDALGGVRQTEYDEFGRIVLQVSPLGGRIIFEYDEQGNRIKHTNALGKSATYEFNDVHLPTGLVDEEGFRWLREYDSSNRVIGTTDPYGAVWRLEYDDDSNLTQVTNPNGAVWRQRFSSDGLPVERIDFAGHKTTFAFDELGRVIQRTDGVGATVRFRYDLRGQLLEVHLPNGSRIVSEYDGAGNVVFQSDPRGAVTRFRYGPCGRLLERVDGLGQRLTLKWGTEPDELLEYVNEAGEVYELQYDDNGRAVYERGFDNRILRYVYNADGYVIETIDGTGRRNSYARDALGQITEKRLYDGSACTFVHDARGSITKADNQHAIVAFERDAYGRILKEVQNDHMIETHYDPLGNPLVVSTSLGHSEATAYDGNGYANSLSLKERLRYRFVRNGRGDEVARVLPGGLRMDQAWDSVGSMTRQIVRSSTSGESVSRAYVRDEGGLITSLSDSHWGHFTFKYDSIGRLVSHNGSDGRAEGFAYDSTTNVVAVERGPDSETFNYAQGGRLTNRDGTSYTYDLEGRLTEKVDSSGARWRFEWDAEDQMRSATTPSGERWEYAYDAFGRRTSKKSSMGKTTAYVWNGDVLVHEVTKDEVAATWVYDPHSFSPLCKIQGDKAYSVIPDQLGSPRELIGADGTIVWSVILTPWGRVAQAGISAVDCPIRFPGQYFDSETGLHYNRFRYYDPLMMRFLSPDPIGLLGGLNLYRYVWDPLTWLDPYGWHGNSRTSTNPQHAYMIVDTQDNSVYKYGISGRPLNQNGTSNRANIQVSRLNSATSPGRFKAVVIGTNLPGRQAALDVEQGRVSGYAVARERGGGLFEGPPGNKRPKPDRSCPK